MATFALKSLFKINLRSRGNVLLAGAQLRAWTADTHQQCTFSPGGRNTSSWISPPSTWVAVQQSCPVSLIPPFHLVKMQRRQTLLQSLSAPSGLSHESQPWEASPERCHKNTESPSSFLYFFIESFIKENRSLNLTSTDLQKAPGVGKWQLFRTVLQMENIKKKS